jgi:hypothetical protein
MSCAHDKEGCRKATMGVDATRTIAMREMRKGCWVVNSSLYATGYHSPIRPHLHLCTSVLLSLITLLVCERLVCSPGVCGAGCESGGVASCWTRSDLVLGLGLVGGRGEYNTNVRGKDFKGPFLRWGHVYDFFSRKWWQGSTGVLHSIHSF